MSGMTMRGQRGFSFLAVIVGFVFCFVMSWIGLATQVNVNAVSPKGELALKLFQGRIS